jgi:hypothetical protein
MLKMKCVLLGCVLRRANGVYITALFLLLLLPFVSCDDDQPLNPESNPKCLVNPTNLDFGQVEVDNYPELAFTITNIGGGTLSGTLSESCDYYSFVSMELEYNLSAGDSMVVRVRFGPGTTGIFNCTIETGTNCSNVTLDGEGIPGEVRP